MVQIGELAGLAVGSTVLLNVMFAGYTINLPSNLTKDFNTVLVTLLNKLELKRWK